MKWIGPICLGLAGLLLVAGSVSASSLLDRVSGYILLQVEQHGEAWYVRPETGERHYMRDGDVAYQMMRFFGLGITDADLATIPAVSTENEMLASTSVCRSNAIANSVKGKILLQVQQHGEAWYVYPLTCRRIYMADGDAAYQIMRLLGLGITDVDLGGIVIGPDTEIEIDDEEEEVIEEEEESEDDTNTSTYATIELRVHDLVNAHRASLGVAELPWNSGIADIARVHSQNMATGAVERGHAGFSERADEVGDLFVAHRSVSENVAWTNHPDPAQSAFDWWLTSSGHRSNLEHTVHTATGIGVAVSNDGVYHFTQLFVDADQYEGIRNKH